MYGPGVVGITAEQKQRVLSMRAQGMTFAQIAAATGIPRNSVKSFYQREAKKQCPEPKNACKHCGAAINQTSKTKQRVYCSDACRYAYWNRQRGERGVPAFVCAHCGTAFAACPSARRKYCSQRCFHAARSTEKV